MLTPESIKAIDREVAKYPAEQRQSAVMAGLRIAQKQNGGWLSREIIGEVADYLQMPAIAAYEVASFYNMYELEPVGRHKITVCTNLSCTLCGALEIGEHLKKRLGIGWGETTADGRFTLKEGECMGACGEAPVCIVDNETMHGKLTGKDVDALLNSLK